MSCSFPQPCAALERVNPPLCHQAQGSACREHSPLPELHVPIPSPRAGGGNVMEDVFSPKSSNKTQILQYLHPCSSSRSSWVHCLDVARSSPSNHKPPAHCIPHNLQGKQKGFKNQVMGWREEMQEFLERHRAHHPNLLWAAEKGPGEVQN